MDGSSKIALGIVAAAALLLLGFISYREFERRRDIADAQEVMRGISDYAQQAMADGRRAEQQRQRQVAYDARMRADALERARRARELSSDERCIAGTVVQISGASYTQLAGVGGRPVACSGRYRLQ